MVKKYLYLVIKKISYCKDKVWQASELHFSFLTGMWQKSVVTAVSYHCFLFAVYKHTQKLIVHTAQV